MTGLTRYYAGWSNYQRLLVDAVRSLDETGLAYRASPSLRPAWMLAGHIISARIYWFHHVLGEGDAALAPLQNWDEDDQPMLSGRELATGLEQSWQLVEDCLARWSVADLDVEFPRRNRTVTRQWVVWHVIEHDLHHGGELFLTLGMHGVPTPDL